MEDDNPPAEDAAEAMDDEKPLMDEEAKME